MKSLEEYLDHKGISVALFSQISCISTPTIYKILRGIEPSKRIALIIEKATKGEVKFFEK